MDAHPYILGTGDDELDRLAHQHEVWRDTTTQLWDLAGFGPGDKIIDLACGPGFTSFELAERVGATGHVTAADNSERFLALVQEWSQQRSVNNLSTALVDAYEPGFPANSADGILIRWLLCFLPDTKRVIQQATKALAPGGRLVVMDYFHYPAIELFPVSEHFRKVFKRVYESFAESGGSLDVASKVPGLMRESGLEVSHIQNIGVVARPGEPVWQWVRAFQKNYLPQMLSAGSLDQATFDAFEKDWLAHEKNPDSLFFSPPMMGVIGRKPA